ncbi:MAG TPA: M15 family metallopeptidase [Candidatus Binatia bacterium]|nr:M15 family metallopeptidase [Candidatus Binatia bacterium]
MPEANLQVAQALRTWSEQDALYAEGRTEPGKEVTKARGGWSAHNFGYAVDLVPEEIEPGQADWNLKHPVWQKMLQVAPTVGLAEGAQWRSFPDNPHFYLSEFPADPTDEMRAALANGSGMNQVWDMFPVTTIAV